MNQFHKMISKEMWFVLFNVGSTLYTIASNRLHWEVISVASFAVALGLINLIAWISARNFPEWK